MSQKIDFKPGNMLYPLPAVMVSCGKGDKANILTVAWAGTVCSDPPMVSISVRPERHSYPLIRESGEFVINLVTEDLVRAADYCGVRSGRDTDKWQDCGLTKAESGTVSCPAIAESPVNIECRVRSMQELGSHTMFTAEVTAVRVDGRYMTDKGSFRLNDAGLITYSHGTYFALGKALGTFGFSVKKKTARPGKDRVRQRPEKKKQ
ncbi:MAG: flavin reductase family protein [Lachnospiraceae bacterium]|nr:flavin reductase family protein [Lachnospiraceae bacterium]